MCNNALLGSSPSSQVWLSEKSSEDTFICNVLYLPFFLRLLNVDTCEMGLGLPDYLVVPTDLKCESFKQ
jgi:hypothetical protein